MTIDDPLDNDHSPSGSPLTIVEEELTNGQNGDCTLEGGSVVYDPNPGFTGIDLCMYTVCDANGLCDEAVSLCCLHENENDRRIELPIGHLPLTLASISSCMIFTYYFHHHM